MKTIYLVTRTGPDYGGEYSYVAAETEEHAQQAAALMGGDVEVEEIKLYEATDALPIEKVTAYACTYVFQPAIDTNYRPVRFCPGSVEIRHGSVQGQPADLHGPDLDVIEGYAGVWAVKAVGWRSAHIAEMVAAEEFNRQLVERGLTVRTSESVQ